MNKIVFVLGSEIFLNNKKVINVQGKEIYIIYFDNIKSSYENALSLINNNIVLFFKPISQVNILYGEYELDLYAIYIYDQKIEISNSSTKLPPLFQSTIIKFPFIYTDFKHKILINYIIKHSLLICVLSFMVWILSYTHFYIEDVDIYDRNGLINSLKK